MSGERVPEVDFGSIIICKNMKISVKCLAGQACKILPSGIWHIPAEELSQQAKANDVLIVLKILQLHHSHSYLHFTAACRSPILIQNSGLVSRTENVAARSF